MALWKVTRASINHSESGGDPFPSPHKKVVWAGSLSLQTQELALVSCWLNKIFMALFVCFWENARSKAHSSGKAKGLPRTECRRQEVTLLWGRGAEMPDFNAQSCFGSSMDYVFLFFRTQMGLSVWCCSGQYTLTSPATPGSGEFIMGGEIKLEIPI